MAQILLGTTPVPLTADRGHLVIQNNSATANLYLDVNESVTTTSGMKLTPGSVFEFPVSGAANTIWIVSDTASTDVRVLDIE